MRTRPSTSLCLLRLLAVRPGVVPGDSRASLSGRDFPAMIVKRMTSCGRWARPSHPPSSLSRRHET